MTQLDRYSLLYCICVGLDVLCAGIREMPSVWAYFARCVRGDFLADAVG